MGPLLDLPNEIVHLIAEQLFPHDLYSLASTCQHTWTVLKPGVDAARSLWARVHRLALRGRGWTRDEESETSYSDWETVSEGETDDEASADEHEDGTMDDATDRMKRPELQKPWTLTAADALASFCELPQLRFLVNHLSYKQHAHSQLSADDLRSFAAQGAIDPGWYEQHTHDLFAGRDPLYQVHVLFVLILLLAPNLKTFHWEVDASIEEEAMISQILRDIADSDKPCFGPQRPLAKLTHASIKSSDEEYRIGLEQCQALIAMPRIQSLTGIRIESSQPISLCSNPLVCNVTTLDFRDSCFDAKELDVLLTPVQSLQRFTYKHTVAVIGDAEFDGPGMIKVLARRAGNSLTDLTVLSSEIGLADDIESWTESASLSSFLKLENLKLDFETLLFDERDQGTFKHLVPWYFDESEELAASPLAHSRTRLVERLPNSLRSLSLVETPWKFMPDLVQLVKDCGNEWGSLDRVLLERENDDFEYDDPADPGLEDLRKACKEAKITLRTRGVAFGDPEDYGKLRLHCLGSPTDSDVE